MYSQNNVEKKQNVNLKTQYFDLFLEPKAP